MFLVRVSFFNCAHQIKCKFIVSTLIFTYFLLTHIFFTHPTIRLQCAHHESALITMKKKSEEHEAAIAASASAAARDSAHASSLSASNGTAGGDAQQIVSALRKQNMRLRVLCALFRSRAIARRIADRRWARAMGDDSMAPAEAATKVRLISGALTF
jgi:hypothetical protein